MVESPLCQEWNSVIERIKRKLETWKRFSIYIQSSLFTLFPLWCFIQICIKPCVKWVVKAHLLTPTQCVAKWIVNEVVVNGPYVAVIFMVTSWKCVFIRESSYILHMLLPMALFRVCVTFNSHQMSVEAYFCSHQNFPIISNTCTKNCVKQKSLQGNFFCEN